MDDGEVKQSKLEDSLQKDSLKNKRTGDHGSVKPERPSGNRVAVKKYREKKKAQHVYLEEEVKKLQAVNRVLTRKLQVQAALEAVAVRLRSLLIGFKVQIGNELGVGRVYKQNCNVVSDGCIRPA
ncbi:basic leucine zipper 23-like [Bidens hawaiensis]|uniref:basic leucine zipper 23-like n=1 Tax=Bidens hawaiensis TaxID=980011 RepID=UPI0040491F88